MNLDFEKFNGLIPAVIQDAASGRVLMLGFMNGEAFEKTRATGDVIVMIDADGSMNPDEMILLIGALLAGADLAKGSRYIEGGGSTVGYVGGLIKACVFGLLAAEDVAR